MNNKRTPLAIRLKRLSRPAKNGCRIWIGSTKSNGRPQIAAGGKHGGAVIAYNAAYQLVHGKIPKGYELHHKCRNMLCINLKHLQLVTRLQHAELHRPAKCIRGHTFTAETTYVRKDNGTRTCLICHEIRRRRYLENKMKITR